MITIRFTRGGEDISSEVAEQYEGLLDEIGLTTRRDDGWETEQLEDLDFDELAHIAFDSDATFAISFEG